MNDAGVRDNNLSNYISRENGITSEGNDLRLNQAGRNKAQQYIVDALNTDLSDGWYPGSATKSANSRAKRPSKRRNEKQKSNGSSLSSNDAIDLLANSVSHSTTSTMSPLNKSLFGLYSINKAYGTKEVTPSIIVQHLYDAFQIQISADSVGKALRVAVKKSPPYVSYRKGSGYRITNTGNAYIESLLKQLPEQQNTTIQLAVTNGVTQHENKS